MTSATPPTANTSNTGKKKPRKPAYPHFTAFAEKWLLPLISVRLSHGQRDGTYTWCAHWWVHRPVSVRIAHLHSAFEASRGSAASSYVTGHVDAHLRTILDAAKGPLHRCTPTEHIPTPSLPFEPVPDEWFTRPRTTGEKAAPAGNASSSDSVADDGDNTKKPPPPRFSHYASWVQQWLLPVTAVRIAAQQREGTYTWCSRWFDHHGVAVRFALLHAAFEAAVISKDHTAMSNLFVRQIDPTMRVILDAAHGPLHRCTPADHLHLPGLPTARVPHHWFGPPGARTPIERAGFGPDFRAFADTDRGATP
ncbi:DUF4913 domain-containing protein [Nocardia higoensis]|uniref:DUF4913 domain-containing protein n=1 Tax=Nocardia higoensis TaxID=228599 RepID=UPI0002F2A0B4|nr:DUF4913 domain-containing protein [Nocardia higoensis]